MSLLLRFLLWHMILNVIIGELKKLDFYSHRDNEKCQHSCLNILDHEVYNYYRDKCLKMNDIEEY